MYTGFILDRIDIQDHTYGLLIKFSVRSIYVGEHNKDECEKKHISTITAILRNIFWDFLNRPADIFDDDDDGSLSDYENELGLNNTLEEKTENYLIEEEEIF